MACERPWRPASPRRAGTASYPFVKHRGGVPWHEAPCPPRLHTCSAQTIQLWDTFTKAGYGYNVCHEGRLRCRCGAVSSVDGWIGRNTRRARRPRSCGLALRRLISSLRLVGDRA